MCCGTKPLHTYEICIASVIGLPAHRIEVDASLGQYGMDSVMAMQLICSPGKTLWSSLQNAPLRVPGHADLDRFFLAVPSGPAASLLGLEPEIVPGAGPHAVTAAPAAPAINRGRPRFAASQPARKKLRRHRRDRPGRPLSAGRTRSTSSGRTCARAATASPRSPRSAGTTVTISTPDKKARQEPTASGAASWTVSTASIRCSSTSRRATRRSWTPRSVCSSNASGTCWKMPATPGSSCERGINRRVGVYVGAMSQQYHAFDSDLIREVRRCPILLLLDRQPRLLLLGLPGAEHGHRYRLFLRAGGDSSWPARACSRASAGWRSPAG